MKARIPYYDKSGNEIDQKVIETTLGRFIIYSYFPKNSELSFEMVDKILTHAEVLEIASKVYQIASQRKNGEN